AEKVQAEQAIYVAVAEVEHVKPEGRSDEPEYGEASHRKHVALLTADRRDDARSLDPVARAVPDRIGELRGDRRISGPGVEYETCRHGRPWTCDNGPHDDQLSVGIERRLVSRHR